MLKMEKRSLMCLKKDARWLGAQLKKLNLSKSIALILQIFSGVNNYILMEHFGEAYLNCTLF